MSKKRKHRPLATQVSKLLTFWIPVRAWRQRARKRLVAGSRYWKVRRVQNRLLDKKVRATERLVVFLVPQRSTMSGGVYSIFSIARHSRSFRHLHGAEVLVMTYPNREKMTYIHQPNFDNTERVFRFEQLLKFTRLKSLTLHIPEYLSADFANHLTPDCIGFLQALPDFHINILNQNIKLMPEPHQLDALRALGHRLTQTNAHHRYANQAVADRYNMPALLLPAYTDLSMYQSADFDEKRDLVIYSPDPHPDKADILAAIGKALPDYELREIRGIPFGEYMDLATQARFAITFGEGYDGYLTQPIKQGGISFAVYNDDFFPTNAYLAYPNIFSSYDEMRKNIVAVMKDLLAKPDEYRELNAALKDAIHSLYSYDDYLDRIRRFYDGDYDFSPRPADGA